MMHLHADTALIENRICNRVCLKTEDRIIKEISYSCSEPPNSDTKKTLIPGFVDIHCHGGAGYYFSDIQLDKRLIARNFHLSRGTTTIIASLISDDYEAMKRQIANLVPQVKDGTFAGIHLEGPYLSPVRCGAHNPKYLRALQLSELIELIEIGQGTIRMVTIAPELKGFKESANILRSYGITVAIGHFDANIQEIDDAFSDGINLVTHFTNAMPKLLSGSHSSADLILENPNIFLEIILDNVHIPTDQIDLIIDQAKDRMVLITDSISAAGLLDGEFTIGSANVNVKDGIARLKENGSLAGSTLTMDQAFLNLYRKTKDLTLACKASSYLPSKILQLEGVGQIKEGFKADFVLFSPETETFEVLR